jgi:hypothetical protein
MRRSISCVLLVSYLASCVSWDVQEVSPEQAVTEQQPKKARVSLSDGSQMTLAHPSVSGDSLTGFVGDDRVSVPLARVSEVALYDLNVVGTAVLAGLAVASLAVLLADCADGDQGYMDFCP